MSRWQVEFDDRAARQLLKLGSTDRQRVPRFLDDRLLAVPDPRTPGKPLAGQLAGFWRYRVGDIRILARLEDERLVIFVVEVGHRREVHR